MYYTTKNVLSFHFLVISLIFFHSYILGTPKQNKETVFVDENGNISNNTLQKILSLTGIHHDGSLEDVVKQTQQVWLRKPGIERWQMEDNYEELRSKLWPLFKQLNIIDIIQPQYKEYEYCIVLGALVSRIRSRLAYALELWNQGIHFIKLIFLVGQRLLDPKLESKEVLYDHNNLYLPIKKTWLEPDTVPITEIEMAKMVFEQAELPKNFLKTIKIIFIDTPGNITENGTFKRPITIDTVYAWLATDPQPGKILTISN